MLCREKNDIWLVAKWSMVVVAVACMLTLISHAVSFELHRKEIAGLIAASPAEKNLPRHVRDILLFSLRGDSITYTTTLVIRKYNSEPFYDGRGNSKITHVVWRSLMPLHFSEDDRLALLARLAPTGGGRIGLEKTAHDLFERPLSELSLEEAATLSVLVKAPFLYKKPDRLDVERNRLIDRYKKKNGK